MGGDDMAGMGDPDSMGGPGMEGADNSKEPRHRFRVRKSPPARDPKLYDYE